uniref:Uncharacterized protein n=1 Tax=Tanacetum cinerariifolium TaxID=118510 RepID=A0A699UB80_TANCI|nr:hypothetical protein [Tanacetum cinerariifolium]
MAHQLPAHGPDGDDHRLKQLGPQNAVDARARKARQVEGIVGEQQPGHAGSHQAGQLYAHAVAAEGPQRRAGANARVEQKVVRSVAIEPGCHHYQIALNIEFDRGLLGPRPCELERLARLRPGPQTQQ